MAGYVSRYWEPDYSGSGSRRQRKGCTYEAYIPDRLVDRDILLDGETAADVADAEIAIARLNGEAAVLAESEALARLLMRSDAVASSRMEGLAAGPRRLLRVQAGFAGQFDPLDPVAEEIAGNVDAMIWAVEAVSAAGAITIALLLELHRMLLTGTNRAGHGGRMRAEQNWIGGGASRNPCGADFVPPPPQNVPALMDDLCDFCNEDRLPAVVQAAIAHAQFETIHPFADGNGRAGRVLAHLVLRRRGLAPKVLPPISLAFASRRDEYVSALSATRYVGEASSPVAHAGLNLWVGVFAANCRFAVGNAYRLDARVRELQAVWRARLGPSRSDSAAALLVAALPKAPVVTVESAAELINRSFQAASQGIARLQEAGILQPRTVGRRNRVFEATELIDAIAAIEEELSN